MEIDEYSLLNKTADEAVWVLQRQPKPDRGETYVQIWFKDDAMKISPVELAGLLARVMSEQSKEVKM